MQILYSKLCWGGHILLFICLLFSRFTGYSQTTAAGIVDSLQKRLQAISDNEEKSTLLNKISFAYLNVDPGQTLVYGRQALQLALAQNQPVQTARAYNNIASGYAVMSAYDSALYYFNLALPTFETAQDEKGRADVLGNIAVILYYRGDYANAMDYTFKALSGFEKVGHILGQANSLAGIANIYMEQDNFDNALHYDSLALKRYEEISDQAGIAMIVGNIGNIYQEKRQFDKAEMSFRQAIRIYEKLGIKLGLARNLSNLSTLLLNRRDYYTAQQMLERAYQTFTEIQFPTGQAYAMGNLGTVYALSAKYYNQPDSVISRIPGTLPEIQKKAVSLLTQALQMTGALNELPTISAFNRELYLLYENMGNHAQALRHYKLYKTTQDSIHSLESQVQIQKLTTQRELELKNKQIELDKLAVQKKRNERIYFIIGLILLAGLVGFIYRNFRNQKNANARLTQLNSQIADTNQLLEQNNLHLSSTLRELKETQEQLIETERQKENAVLRSKISQDIHDDISSNLTKISWLAETLKTKSSHPDTAGQLVEKINSYSRETASKLGEIIWSTNPERDNLDSLLAYMRSFLHNFLEDSTLHYQIDFPDSLPTTPINPELRRNLFLVFKEAVHNAVKYSQATQLVVSFHSENNSVLLRVADNGIGMQSGQIQGGGDGLLNMEKRMAAVGGTMHINSRPGEGTRLEFKCPLVE